MSGRREGLTHREIGELLGLSGERVRQIEARALRKLRALVEAREAMPADHVRDTVARTHGLHVIAVITATCETSRNL